MSLVQLPDSRRISYDHKPDYSGLYPEKSSKTLMMEIALLVPQFYCWLSSQEIVPLHTAHPDSRGVQKDHYSPAAVTELW